MKCLPFTRLSPCKLNLFLYITGKRPDGYHNLQTLFTLLDYGDEITFMPREHGKVQLLTDFGFPQEENLIYKAAMLMRSMAKSPFGIDITINKVLPQGGGLGGGSSNAATTLLALNKLWKIGLSIDRLEQLGLELGSDVPIFIHGKSAYAEGRGEIFTDIPLRQETYLVAIPSCHVSTKELFQDPLLPRDTPKRSIHELMKLPFSNDFTQIVKKYYPEISFILKILPRYALDGKAYLTGSGGCCFIKKRNLTDGKISQEILWNKHQIKSFVANSCLNSTSLQKTPTY